MPSGFVRRRRPTKETMVLPLFNIFSVSVLFFRSHSTYTTSFRTPLSRTEKPISSRPIPVELALLARPSNDGGIFSKSVSVSLNRANAKKGALIALFRRVRERNSTKAPVSYWRVFCSQPRRIPATLSSSTTFGNNPKLSARRDLIREPINCTNARSYSLGSWLSDSAMPVLCVGRASRWPSALAPGTFGLSVVSAAFGVFGFCAAF